MNRVFQGRRQLLMEVRRLGSYRGYDTYHSFLILYQKNLLFGVFRFQALSLKKLVFLSLFG